MAMHRELDNMLLSHEGIGPLLKREREKAERERKEWRRRAMLVGLIGFVAGANWSAAYDAPAGSSGGASLPPAGVRAAHVTQQPLQPLAVTDQMAHRDAAGGIR